MVICGLDVLCVLHLVSLLPLIISVVLIRRFEQHDSLTQKKVKLICFYNTQACLWFQFAFISSLACQTVLCVEDLTSRQAFTVIH